MTIAVPPYNTSQNCSHCGKKVKKSLSTRTHVCLHCGYIADRDVAAGQNIRNRGIALISTAGPAGKETARAADLPGTELAQSRQVSRSRKRVTRKPRK